MTRRLPLEVKLPLLMSVVLALVLGIDIVATYSTLRELEMDRVQDRLVRGSRQRRLGAPRALSLRQDGRPDGGDRDR